MTKTCRCCGKMQLRALPSGHLICPVCDTVGVTVSQTGETFRAGPPAGGYR